LSEEEEEEEEEEEKEGRSNLMREGGREEGKNDKRLYMQLLALPPSLSPSLRPLPLTVAVYLVEEVRTWAWRHCFRTYRSKEGRQEGREEGRERRNEVKERNVFFQKKASALRRRERREGGREGG
jgi:hypothetical protein